jgi:hypothetical protein
MSPRKALAPGLSQVQVATGAVGGAAEAVAAHAASVTAEDTSNAIRAITPAEGTERRGHTLASHRKLVDGDAPPPCFGGEATPARSTVTAGRLARSRGSSPANCGGISLQTSRLQHRQRS